MVRRVDATSEHSKVTTIPHETRKKSTSSYQQQLFSQVLDTLYESQKNISSSHWVIIYKPNGESGLANVFIGLVSCIIAALSTGRGVQSN